MRLRSSLSLIGAICALAGLASAGLAQGQGSPPAGQAGQAQAAAPVITPRPLLPATGGPKLTLLSATPAPVIKMSAGQWLYLGGADHGRTLWVAPCLSRFSKPVMQAEPVMQARQKP